MTINADKQNIDIIFTCLGTEPCPGQFKIKNGTISLLTGEQYLKIFKDIKDKQDIIAYIDANWEKFKQKFSNTHQDDLLLNKIEKISDSLFVTPSGLGKKINFQRKIIQLVDTGFDIDEANEIAAHPKLSQLCFKDIKEKLEILLSVFERKNALKVIELVGNKQINLKKLLEDVPIVDNQIEITEDSTIIIMSKVENNIRTNVIKLLDETFKISLEYTALLIKFTTHYNSYGNSSYHSLNMFLPLFAGFLKDKSDQMKKNDLKAITYLIMFFNKHYTCSMLTGVETMQKFELVGKILEVLSHYRAVRNYLDKRPIFNPASQIQDTLTEEGFPALQFVKFLEDNNFQNLSVAQMQALIDDPSKIRELESLWQENSYSSAIKKAEQNK